MFCLGMIYIILVYPHDNGTYFIDVDGNFDYLRLNINVDNKMWFQKSVNCVAMSKAIDR